MRAGDFLFVHNPFGLAAWAYTYGSETNGAVEYTPSKEWLYSQPWNGLRLVTVGLLGTTYGHNSRMRSS